MMMQPNIIALSNPLDTTHALNPRGSTRTPGASSSADGTRVEGVTSSSTDAVPFPPTAPGGGDPYACCCSGPPPPFATAMCWPLLPALLLLERDLENSGICVGVELLLLCDATTAVALAAPLKSNRPLVPRILRTAGSCVCFDCIFL